MQTGYMFPRCVGWFESTLTAVAQGKEGTDGRKKNGAQVQIGGECALTLIPWPLRERVL